MTICGSSLMTPRRFPQRRSRLNQSAPPDQISLFHLSPLAGRGRPPSGSEDGGGLSAGSDSHRGPLTRNKRKSALVTTSPRERGEVKNQPQTNLVSRCNLTGTYLSVPG